MVAVVIEYIDLFPPGAADDKAAEVSFGKFQTPPMPKPSRNEESDFATAYAFV